MDLSALKVNSTAAEQGDWVRDIPGLGDIAFKVRGNTNSDARRRRSELINALSFSQRKDPKALDAVSVKVIVETVLLDWSGLTDAGVAIPYSREKATELLSNPDYVDFANGVAWAAASVGTDASDKIETDAGN